MQRIHGLCKTTTTDADVARIFILSMYRYPFVYIGAAAAAGMVVCERGLCEASGGVRVAIGRRMDAGEPVASWCRAEASGGERASASGGLAGLVSGVLIFCNRPVLTVSSAETRMSAPVVVVLRCLTTSFDI